MIKKRLINKNLLLKNKKEDKLSSCIIVNSRKLKKINYVFLNLIFLQKGKITNIKKDILNFKIRKGERLGSFWKLIKKDILNSLFLRIKTLRGKKKKKQKSKFFFVISDMVKEINYIKIKKEIKIEMKKDN